MKVVYEESKFEVCLSTAYFQLLSCGFRTFHGCIPSCGFSKLEFSTCTPCGVDERTQRGGCQSETEGPVVHRDDLVSRRGFGRAWPSPVPVNRSPIGRNAIVGRAARRSVACRRRDPCREVDRQRVLEPNHVPAGRRDRSPAFFDDRVAMHRVHHRDREVANGLDCRAPSAPVPMPRLEPAADFLVKRITRTRGACDETASPA